MSRAEVIIKCDLLVQDCTLLTVDSQDTVIEDGALAIDGGRIVFVGSRAQALQICRAARTLDAQGGVVHPGFIDPHTHVSQYTSRSVLPLMEGTAITMGAWKAALEPDDEQASAMLAAIDYLSCGYTGFVDAGTIFDPDSVAAVAGQTGIRIWLTDPYVADRGHALALDLPELHSEGFLARWPKNLDDALSRMGSQLYRNRGTDGLVRAYVGLYGEGTDSPQLYQAALELATARGVQFQEHLGYLPAAYLRRERTGDGSMVAQLDKAGMLSDRVTLTHMNVVHLQDVDVLAKRNVRIVWAPYGQLQMLGRGGVEGRMVELLQAGVCVGIASDIPRASGFDGLGCLALAAAAATGRPAKPSEILRMRTIGSAATIGAQSELGSLEIGKYADLVIRKPLNSASFGFDRALEAGILAGRDSVQTVLVNGVPRIEGGELPTLDACEVAVRAHASALRLAKQIGLRC